jgi:hypothetical protein
MRSSSYHSQKRLYSLDAFALIEVRHEKINLLGLSTTHQQQSPWKVVVRGEEEEK